MAAVDAAGDVSTRRPVLVVFAGLPGTGKTTLSRRVAADLGAAILRVDAIEAAVVRLGLAQHPVGVVGYTVARELAAGCLAVGTSVVVDAVNPIQQVRADWRALADDAGARLVVIEVTVSDRDEHRRRVERRRTDLDGLVVPTWRQVESRRYETWDEKRDGPRVAVDTAAGVEPALAVIRRALAG